MYFAYGTNCCEGAQALDRTRGLPGTGQVGREVRSLAVVSLRIFRRWFPKASHEFQRRAWQENVMEFSCRNLSSPADKPPALAGMAKRFQELARSRSSAGPS